MLVRDRSSYGPGPNLSIGARNIGHGLSLEAWIRDCCGELIVELRGCGLRDPILPKGFLLACQSYNWEEHIEVGDKGSMVLL